ncbi:hypothetical protein [Endozoicomonas sp. YOMI1]|uniref:hypothetical protein n=1 Tax=Endozoicomonas sp. YOMI1 TaxID=2828739 RepID=UPI002148D558|nr:hypothetical protein [Endozoicomonas sp. YOMI1]
MNKKAVLSDQYVKRCILFILLLILPFRLAYAVPEDYFISAETVASNLDNYLLIDAREYSMPCNRSCNAAECPVFQASFCLHTSRPQH